MSTPIHSRNSDDELPDDCPAGITSCRGYCDWRARQAGDMLPAALAVDLTLFAGYCALQVAIRRGLPELPDVP
jgi:hypothetical protein